MSSLSRGRSFGVKLSPREEERIAFPVFSGRFGVVLLRIELLPHARGIDVFVSFVPTAIDDFSQCWIIGRAFQLGVRDVRCVRSLCTALLCGLEVGYG
jgi:hypothetical protein